jgi:hypothetical protein
METKFSFKSLNKERGYLTFWNLIIEQKVTDGFLTNIFIKKIFFLGLSCSKIGTLSVLTLTSLLSTFN